ncbi:MAG: DUF2782 domain-containing protein [Pseudomonadota bacterium]
MTLASLLAGPALAQERPRLEPLPDIPPPPGMVDPGLEPQITIKQKGEDKVEEFRIKGRLYMIKVTPSHGKAYFLIDQKGDGLMRRYDDLSPNFQVPLWVIGEF